MRPLDPRLLRWARATRGFLVTSTVIGALTALAVIAQGILLTDVVVGVFTLGWGTDEAGRTLTLLMAAVVARAVLAWATEVAAHRAAAQAKSQLRSALMERTLALGPVLLTSQRRAELSLLATRGVDSLDDYFARYLPQLSLAVIVPGLVGAVILAHDWIAASTIILTLPLIPVFMILIGKATARRVDRQWRSMARLSGHFLDLVSGLPTLKVFGRARGQTRGIAAVGEQYRTTTMGVLRLSFLSSLALELIATLAVAIIAVGIGVRLVNGELDLHTGLLVLVLAPEVYLPLRLVGLHFHAAAEGLGAAQRIVEVLETPVPYPGAGAPLQTPVEAIAVHDLRVDYPGRHYPALEVDDLTLRRGRVTAITGPSGSGKSTLVNVLMGFAPLTKGSVTLMSASGTSEIHGVDLDDWRAQVAYVGQAPWLTSGTLRDNVIMGRPNASDADISHALVAAGLDLEDPDVRVTLPHGLDTPLRENGVGVSAGQRRRIALARAFLRDAAWVILDEPTAALDGATEDVVVAAVRAFRDQGRGVIVVAHRAALIGLADDVVVLDAAYADGPGNLSPGDGRPQESAADLPIPEALREAEPSASLGGSSRSPLARVGATLRPVRGRIVVAALLGAAAVGSAIGLMGTSGWLISRASQMPPVLYLTVATVGVRALGLGRGVFRYAERLLSHDAAFRSLTGLRIAVYQKLERLAPQGLGRWSRGDVLARVVGDVDRTVDLPLRVILPVGIAVAAGVGSVGFVAWLSSAAAGVLALGLLCGGLIVPAVAVAAGARAQESMSPLRGLLTERVVDLLSGTADVVANGRSSSALRDAEAVDDELTSRARQSSMALGLSSGLGVLTSGATLVAILVVGAWAVRGGHLDGVWFATLALIALASNETVAGLPKAALVRAELAAGATRIVAVADADDPLPDPTEHVDLPVRQGPRAVRLSGVHAGWGSNGATVLHDIDLLVAPGRRVAVLGSSGSGKSTLAAVLLRFVDIRSGDYDVDGLSVRSLTGDEVRTVVGACAQDSHIFDTSIRENLRIGRIDATDADLWNVLAAVRLDGWVRSLPDGLSTDVGDEGSTLSGGQRQRLAFARSLLADHDVLVLDEPTEHLDLATADALVEDLVALTRGRSTVLFTHRVKGILQMDEIVVLEAGHIVERGAPATLLADPQSRLSSMVARENAMDSLVPEVV